MIAFDLNSLASFVVALLVEIVASWPSLVDSEFVVMTAAAVDWNIAFDFDFAIALSSVADKFHCHLSMALQSMHLVPHHRLALGCRMVSVSIGLVECCFDIAVDTDESREFVELELFE